MKTVTSYIPLIVATLLIGALYFTWISPAIFCLLVMILMLCCLFTEIYTPALSLTTSLAIIVTGSLISPVLLTINGASTSSFLDIDSAFRGFSNRAVITIGSLFVVAAAIRSTGIINLFAISLLSGAKTLKGILSKLAAPIIGMSAIFNNTPIVAIFIPSVREYAINNKISPSKLLLPIVYLTTFGGMFTLVGTSTNIMINQMLITDQINDGFKMFDFTKVALPAAVIGVIYLITIGSKLLPDRKDLLEGERDELRKYLVEMEVEIDSPFIGKTVEQSKTRNLPNLFLFAIRRDGKLITPIHDNTTIRREDRLIFTGEHQSIQHLNKVTGLSSPTFCDSPEIDENTKFVEAVIPGTSSLLGKTIEDVWFNQRYDATVIALHRNGENIDSSLSRTPLKAGDTLLMVVGAGYSEVWKTSSDFYFVSGIERQQIPTVTTSTIVTILITLAMIIIPAVSTIGIEYTSVMAAILITVIKKSRNIFMQIDWNVLVVIGAAFGIKKAFENSGADVLVSNFTINLTSIAGPIGALILIYIVTNIMTELITNNAAAALIFPIAVKTAASLNVSIYPFIVAIAFAASASFSTPVGYQTNMMVYGPGGYKFSDYVKVGLPLNFIYLIIVVVLTPIFWPF